MPLLVLASGRCVGWGGGTVRGKALALIYKPSFLSTINQVAGSLVPYFSVGST